MRKTPIVLVVIGLTLFGCLGGIFAFLVLPTQYQADAYVVVYEMPDGFRNVLSPDLANQLDAVYRGGALQDAVVDRVVASVPGISAETVRQSVRVSIVAYTPLTRVSAFAPTAENAAEIANAVGTAWTSYTASAADEAYKKTRDALTGQERLLEDRIAQTTKGIAAVNPTTHDKQNLIAALQTQLSEQLQQQTEVQRQISRLDTARVDAPGDAYITIKASTENAVQTPDPLKIIGGGAGAGLALGLVFAAWVIRRHVMRESRPQATETPRFAGVLP